MGAGEAEDLLRLAVTSLDTLSLLQACHSQTLKEAVHTPAHDTPAAVSEQPYPLYLCGKQTVRTPPHFTGLR